jgi:hypothetical protein
VEFAEEAHLAPNLTQEGSWNEGAVRDLELVGEAQKRPSLVPALEPRNASPRPWPVILAFVTLVVDIGAVSVGCRLAWLARGLL